MRAKTGSSLAVARTDVPNFASAECAGSNGKEPARSLLDVFAECEAPGFDQGKGKVPMSVPGEMEHEYEESTEVAARGEHELARSVLELQEASELEGFLPFLIGPLLSGLRALAPVVVKAAVPVLKQIGARSLPNLRRRTQGEHEGFLPIIGSVVSGLLGGELEGEHSEHEHEHEIGRRYVRLSRLAAGRAARQVMAALRSGERPTTSAIRRIVAGAVRSAAETLFGSPARSEQLARELLEVHEANELEHFLGDLIGPIFGGLRNLAPVAMRAAVPMLKSVASRSLPALESVLGRAGDAGEMEGFLGSIVGGLLGGELEHEHEVGRDPDFYRATWFVRLASAAARRAAWDLTSMLDRGEQPSRTTVRQIIANAIFTTARPASTSGAPGSPSRPTGGRPPSSESGPWQRQGTNLVLYL